MTTIIKPSMTIKQINKALKSSGEFLFKSGTYNLTKTMVIYSNTTVNCEPNVVFNRKHGGRMMQLFVDANTTKYNGTHDVSWSGGRFVANTNNSSGIVIVVCHCKNIKFNNVIVDGCVELHSFEINSSQHVTIKNCTIMNQTTKPDEPHKEAVQIDFCYKGGLSIKDATAESPCYDDTHCDDVTISNCKFINCPNGVGTHTVSEDEEYHTNITIKDCIFTNIGKNAIRLLGMKTVVVSGCSGDGKLLVDKTKKAHRSVGGKVTLPSYRYNIGVTINDVVIA